MKKREKVRIERMDKSYIPTAHYIMIVSMEESYKEFMTTKEIRFHVERDHSDDELIDLLKKSEDSIYLAYIDLEPVGVVIMDLDFDLKKCMVNAMFVVPEFQSLGVGTALAKHVLQ